MFTFKHGVLLHDYHKRRTEAKEIRLADLPAKVILPLQQNLGCPAESLVKVGDVVLEGQKIADSSKLISVPVHASISGKVTAIEKMPNPCGYDVVSVVIEGDGDDSRNSKVEILPAGRQGRNSKTENGTPDEIRKIVREAGIVGLGGAAFPTHVKLLPPADKKIDTVIINGCECEPYVTADHRIMLERTGDIIFGAQAIAKAVGAQRIIVGVEENKKDAWEKMKFEILPAGRQGRNSKFEINPNNQIPIQIILIKTKYPQGGEKMLIKALLKREVPSRGLPSDIGVLVQSVGTAAAIAEAIKFNQPLTQRVVTVTGGGVREPQNLLARVGTPFIDLINQSGGLTEDAAKVIMGGPMMGIALSSFDFPIVKATNSILVLRKSEVRNYEESPCIRCGRCIKACPMGLTPNFIADAAKLKDWDQAGEYNVADCIECGCCSYVCPARIYLVQYFKTAKYELQTRRAVCS
ncbi:MAG: electron transport complex subunit RsxC [Candidatus Margulisiibacteriota bacterium]